MSPVSGSEPRLNTLIWNKKTAIKESHNCFAYAMNTLDTELIKKCKDSKNCDVGFPQPGYASGYGKFSVKRDKCCFDMVSRLWGDNPDVKPIEFHQRCNNASSKIALIVDPYRDYHFLRQDPDGYWSHKPGAMNVTRLDSSNRPIIRPDRATFIYKNHKEPLSYTKFCGYFCVPRDKPMMMMNELRQEGGVESSRKSTRYQKTRRKPRSVSHQ